MSSRRFSGRIPKRYGRAQQGTACSRPEFGEYKHGQIARARQVDTTVRKRIYASERSWCGNAVMPSRCYSPAACRVTTTRVKLGSIDSGNECLAFCCRYTKEGSRRGRAMLPLNSPSPSPAVGGVKTARRSKGRIMSVSYETTVPDLSQHHYERKTGGCMQCCQHGAVSDGCGIEYVPAPNWAIASRVTPLLPPPSHSHFPIGTVIKRERGTKPRSWGKLHRPQSAPASCSLLEYKSSRSAHRSLHLLTNS
jgi:hypothetical protein